MTKPCPFCGGNKREIEAAEIEPTEKEVEEAGEFLDHWFGAGKWPPVHNLDVMLATYGNAAVINHALAEVKALRARQEIAEKALREIDEARPRDISWAASVALADLAALAAKEKS